MSKKKTLTIRERAEQLSNDYLDVDSIARIKFVSEIMELIERAKSPIMFCDKCDMRMSIDLDSGVLNCFNCGNEFRLNKPASLVERKKEEVPLIQKTKVDPDKKPDNKLIDAINVTEKKDNKSNFIGDKIRKLANSRGGSNPTKEDEDALRSVVPELKGKSTGINWC